MVIMALAAIYLFIPSVIRINVKISLNAALPGVYRMLSNESNWDKWWPGIPFTCNNQFYKIQGRKFNAFDILVQNGKDSFNSQIELISITADTMAIEWNAELKTSKNPLTRIDQYRRAKQTRRDMGFILRNLKPFFEKEENIYGFDVKEIKVVDSVLITTRRSFDHPPGTSEIYSMIQALKNYISKNTGKEKNFPMLHVWFDGSQYEVMTAIPVDRELPKTNEFEPKFLLKGGNILETEIKGGPNKVDHAFKEFENYRADHQYTSPAIPFGQLVTDRIKEADTSKWITRLYYPVL